MNLTKQDYLRVRHRLGTSKGFLVRWCEEEARDFEVLKFIFKVYPHTNELLNDLITYLDRKFSVTRLYGAQGQFLRVW